MLPQRRHELILRAHHTEGPGGRLGGLVRRTYHSMVGFPTEHALLLGGDGHVTGSTVVEAPVKRAMFADAGPDALDVVTNPRALR